MKTKQSTDTSNEPEPEPKSVREKKWLASQLQRVRWRCCGSGTGGRITQHHFISALQSYIEHNLLAFPIDGQKRKLIKHFLISFLRVFFVAVAVNKNLLLLNFSP